ncbi:MAG: DUF5683 domain-containing protein [Ignavibacteriaceae bacterium]|jgi:hypothetical protein|nr:DUF5683 domain-containing protein [Ignavibacteriaceae bacterium]
MKTLKIFSAVILFSTLSFSQVNESSKLQLTGNLYADSKIISNSYAELNRNPMADDLPGKKSPVISGVLSAILPGAGQVYNEDWWIAGIFVAVEAALITTAVVYDNKGDDQTEYFESYADDYTNPEHNWSVVRYAEWLAQYEGADLSKIVISDDETLPPWERVNWAELNAAEKGSHKLPPHGEQQYYELIGKYHQYSGGWNDYTGGANNSQISPNYIYYSGQRGLANDYYNTSSTAIVGVYINHILSAAEAVWGATRFNKNLAVNFRVEPLNTATGTELVPTLKFKFSF